MTAIKTESMANMIRALEILVEDMKAGRVVASSHNQHKETARMSIVYATREPHRFHGQEGIICIEEDDE